MDDVIKFSAPQLLARWRPGQLGQRSRKRSRFPRSWSAAAANCPVNPCAPVNATRIKMTSPPDCALNRLQPYSALKLLQVDGRFPTEISLGLRRSRDKELNFGWTIKLRIDTDEFLTRLAVNPVSFSAFPDQTISVPT